MPLTASEPKRPEKSGYHLFAAETRHTIQKMAFGAACCVYPCCVVSSPRPVRECLALTP